MSYLDTNKLRHLVADGHTLAKETVLDLLTRVERQQDKELRQLAVAQPVVNSVEVIPAKLQTISWESAPEHNVWSLEQDQTFVGLVVDAQRGWSLADKITIHIDRPEVKP